MSREDAFYFAGDLSEAEGDRARLDHLERRLETYLENQRLETERLRLIRRSWMQASFSQSVAHNANTVPTLSVQYDRPGWGITLGNRVIPTVPGYYRCTVYAAASAIPGSGRMISGALLNNATFFGSADNNPIGGSPEQAPSSRILLMNGTTDYVNVFLYQFQGSGTAATTISGALTIELVDFFENI